jgi:Flp pilus assembly protein TadB
VVVLVGHPLGLALAVLAASVTWRAAGRLEPPAVRRRRERLAADLPHVVDLMAATLAVGLAPPVALARVAAAVDGPVAEELGTLAARLALGIDPAAAWAELGRHPQLGPLGRCVSRSVDSGVSVADAMARLSDDLRRDLRSQVEARARAVGVRAAVPLGVCMLPAFLLVGVVPLVVGAVPVVLGR